MRNPAVVIFNPQVWELTDLHQEKKENEDGQKRRRKKTRRIIKSFKKVKFFLRFL